MGGEVEVGVEVVSKKSAGSAEAGLPEPEPVRMSGCNKNSDDEMMDGGGGKGGGIGHL